VVQAGTVSPLYRPVGAGTSEMAEATGATIRNIVGAPHIATARPRTDLGATRAVIRLPNVRQAPGKESLDKAGT
jgi:hypothetical protein